MRVQDLRGHIMALLIMDKTTEGEPDWYGAQTPGRTGRRAEVNRVPAMTWAMLMGPP
jgi:hypothetical protein